MGMSMRLGKSNAWSLSGRGKIANAISISYELVERTSEKTTYKVIVTIDNLSVRMNRRVDDGEIYVCLYELAHNWRGINNESENLYCCYQNCTSGTNSRRYLQKVVRGKNKYIFTVNLYQALSDTFYSWGNSYSRMVYRTKYVWGDDAENGIYYIIGASLLHITNIRYNHNRDEHYENVFLKESSYDFRWYSNMCGNNNDSSYFTNMFSFASNLTRTSPIKLEL